MNKISFLVFWVLQHLACERQHSGFLDDSTATQTPTIKEWVSLCVKFCHFLLGFQRSFESVADTCPRMIQIRGKERESSETLQSVVQEPLDTRWVCKRQLKDTVPTIYFSLWCWSDLERADLLHCTFSFRHGERPAWVSWSQNQQTFVGDEDGRRET